MINPFWVEDYDWGCTNINHIWECVQTGKYHFSDEAEQIDVVGYNSLEECETALIDYAKGLS